MAVALTTACFALAHIALAYPGIMSWDSNFQYGQAVTGRYDTWHPPMLAVLWGALLHLQDGAGPLLILQIVLYWFAFYLIAAGLVQASATRRAVFVLVLAAFPNLLVMTAFIFKDVGMAVANLSAFALVFHARIRGRKLGVVRAIAVVALLTFATLLRANAIFAVAPIAIYAFQPAVVARPVRLGLLGLALIGLAIPAVGAINTRLFGAVEARPILSLIAFDMVGVAHFSRDADVIPGGGPDALAVTDSCYSPVNWSGISHGPCGRYFAWPGPSMGRWAKVIVTHPVAYARHRLAHLNEALFFIAPAREFDWNAFDYRPILPRPRLEEEAKRALHFLSNFPLFSPSVPIVGCSIVLLLTLLHAGRTLRDETLSASFYLSASAVLYTVGLLFVGVGSMYRFQQNTMMMGWLAIVLFCTADVRGAAWLVPARRAILAGMAVTILVVAVARVTLSV